jgi:lysine-N-methylase
VVVAAARAGHRAKPERVAELFAQLEALGWLAEGEQPGEEALDAAQATEQAHAAADELDRPVRSLPGFALTCDGSGTCCRFFGTVLASDDEASRALAWVPEVASLPSPLVPERGSVRLGGVALPQVDGACTFLDERLGCRVHARAGGAAKPIGCQLYPASFVDDGESVRVAPRPDCACVLRSESQPGGAPLIGPEVALRRHLPPAVWIDRVPPLVEVAGGVLVPRAEALAALDALAEGVDSADDVPQHLVDRAAALAGLEAETSPTPALAFLVASLDATHAEEAAWRSERDLVRRARGWLRSAACAVGPSARPASQSEREHERFAVKSLAFGRLLLTRGQGRPLATELVGLALSMWLARALADEVDAQLDPSLRAPLALVEALLRGHGLYAYLDDARADGLVP